MTEEYILQAGNKASWQQFAKAHHEFLLHLPKLVELSNKTFNREWATAEPLDRVVFTFGVMCWEDFEEILLLGANGYGFGCLKILRGMYENRKLLAPESRRDGTLPGFSLHRGLQGCPRDIRCVRER